MSEPTQPSFAAELAATAPSPTTDRGDGAEVVRLRAGRYKLRADDDAAVGFREFIEHLCHGAELLRVRQFGDPGDRWQLLLRVDGVERVVDLTLSNLTKPSEFKARVGPVIGRTPRPRRGGMDDVADAVYEAVRSELGEIVDSGLSREDETREWLEVFADELPTVDPADASTMYGEYLLGSGASFMGTDGRLYVRPGELRRAIDLDHRESVSTAQVRARLGELGFGAEQLSAREPGGGEGGTVRKLRFWVAPVGFEL